MQMGKFTLEKLDVNKNQIELKRSNMADISKCGNAEKCKHKEKCYRNLAPSSRLLQAYANFYKKDEECEFFWKIKNSGKKSN